MAEEIFDRENVNCTPEEEYLYMAKNQNGIGDENTPKGGEEGSIKTIKHSGRKR